MQDDNDQDIAISIISNLINCSNEAQNIYDVASNYKLDPNLTEPGKQYVYDEYIRDFLREHSGCI